MTLWEAFRWSPFEIPMLFSVFLAASVAGSVIPQTVALESLVEPWFTGRFFGLLKTSDRDKDMKEISLRMLKDELSDLEKKVQDLEEHLKHKCDVQECARLEHDADDLFDEVDYNSQNIAQLFLILQSVISQLDPCNRHFPHHTMTKKRQRHHHKRYDRELDFEALYDDFVVLQNETGSRPILRVENYGKGEMGEEEGEGEESEEEEWEGEEWEAEAEKREGEERDVDEVEEKAFGERYAMGKTEDAGYLGRKSGSKPPTVGVKPPGKGGYGYPGYGYQPPPLIPIPFPYPQPQGRKQMKGGDNHCVSSLFQHCCGK